MKKYFRTSISLFMVAFLLIPLFALPANAATTFERKLGVPIEYQFNYKTVVCYINGVAKTTSSSGCGATSASMVVEYFTGNSSQTPYTMFKWAYDNGYYTGSGLSYAAVKKLCNNYGVTLNWVGTQAEIISALKAGNPIIALMGPGTFTSGGHYIVLSGIKIEDGTTYIRVNDPNSSSRTNNYYSLSTIWSEKRTSSSTPFGVCTYSSSPKSKVEDFYVEPGKYSKVYSSDGSLNIRASASSSASILGTIPSGTFVKVQSVSGSWAYVTYNGVTGYVYNTYLKDGGQATVSAPNVTTDIAVAYGNTTTVSWSAVSSATGYKYTVTSYPGEISAGGGSTVASATITGKSFTIPAQTAGKYLKVTVTAIGEANTASTTRIIMLGSWVVYPSDVQYIPIADINGSTNESNSTVWTATKGSAFSAVYWDAFLCSANNDGTYTVKNVYYSGASKSVTVSGTDVLFAIHIDYTNYSYAHNIVVGDRLSLCGIYLDNTTIRGSGHILVNGGVPLAPTDITSVSASVSKIDSKTYGGFAEKTSISDAKAVFEENCEYMEIRNALGVRVADTDTLCTGFSVNIVVNNIVKKSYYLVVCGDITGDGVINTADYVIEKKIIKQAASLSGAYKLAADIDGDGSVSTMDYVLVAGHISGKKVLGG